MAEIEVIAHHQQERVAADVILGPEDGVGVAGGLVLLNEIDLLRMRPGCRACGWWTTTAPRCRTTARASTSRRRRSSMPRW